VNSKGYPCLAVDGVSKLVTRLVVERLIDGPSPANELICHTCDVPRCVNPAHLYRGDDATNTADKVCRGRQPRGERNGRAKLTAADVWAIRAASTGRHGELTLLARQYGVDRRTITDVIRGRSWAA
jgi:hypothetical protein